MERVGEHPVPAGPLAVRWLGYEIEEQRAGVATRARVRLENAGSAPWRSRGREGVQLAYHWLDPLGNAIVWDGTRTGLPDAVRPGETVELEASLLAPRPPGSYRLAFDLVEEFRFWFQELGSTPLDVPVDVRPRIDERRLGVRIHGAARSRAGSRPRSPGRADRHRRRCRRRSPRSRRDPRARLVAPPARRACGGLRRCRRGNRRRVAKRPPPTRRLGAGRRPESAPRRATSAAVTPRRDGARGARGLALLQRERRPLRGSGRRQTSVAIRSSERLKTYAPIARATAAATNV